MWFHENYLSERSCISGKSPTTLFITGVHGLTLVCSKYYKDFLLSSISYLLKNKKFVWNFSYEQHFWSYTSQRKQSQIYFNSSIICQSYNSSLNIAKSILETYWVTLIDRCKKQRYYKDRKLTEFTDRIGNISMVDIIKQNEFYHRGCYKTFWNLNEVKRA